MKLRCPRQHRMGETCGAKLVHHESVTRCDEPCRTCQDIDTKKRRLQRERANIERWRREGDRFAASIAKAEREARELERTIQEMNQRRPVVMMKMNGQENSATSSQTSLPPVGLPTDDTNRHQRSHAYDAPGSPPAHQPSRHSNGHARDRHGHLASRPQATCLPTPAASPVSRHAVSSRHG